MTEATHLAMDLSGLKLKLVQLVEPRMGKSRDFDAALRDATDAFQRMIMNSPEAVRG